MRAASVPERRRGRSACRDRAHQDRGVLPAPGAQEQLDEVAQRRPLVLPHPHPTSADTGCPTSPARPSGTRIRGSGPRTSPRHRPVRAGRPTLWPGPTATSWWRATSASADRTISAVNLVGSAVTLDERFEHIGPAFLTHAPGSADPDLPTRIAALRRSWRSMTVYPLSQEGAGDRALEQRDRSAARTGCVALAPDRLRR